MKASLRNFLQLGVLGSIEPGMKRAAIEHQLGAPEAWEATAPNYHNATIWKFGDIEFHFQHNTLDMLFMDEFSIPHGGHQIELEAWVINGSLTCPAAERHLLAEGIAYGKEVVPYNDNGTHLITSANTVLAFSGADAEKVTLRALYRRRLAASAITP